MLGSWYRRELFAVDEDVVKPRLCCGTAGADEPHPTEFGSPTFLRGQLFNSDGFSTDRRVAEGPCAIGILSNGRLHLEVDPGGGRK